MNLAENNLAENPDLVKLNAKQSKNFWRRVNYNGPIHPYNPELGRCWLWTGSGLKSRGYGSFVFGEKLVSVHRLSYRMFVGKIQPEKPHILHSCDVRNCLNPTHVWAGTNADNIHDKEKKGRGNQPFGERNSQSKLTSEMVIQIRNKFASGMKKRHIAIEYKVDPALVDRIIRRVLWKHV